MRREIRLVVERLCDTENPRLNRMARERLNDELLRLWDAPVATLGLRWGM